MLAIRMQRTGRKGHAMFRVVVQDARLTPTSGKVVASVGHYDPHAKSVTLDKEKITFYLDHGAQPSDSTARLLKREGVKLPDWVKISDNKARTVRNADKRRSTRPAEPVAEAAPEAEVPAAALEEPVTEAPAETEVLAETETSTETETTASAVAEVETETAVETAVEEEPAAETEAAPEVTEEAAEVEDTAPAGDAPAKDAKAK